MSLGGVLALFGAVVDFVVDTLAGVPGIVLMYVILVVSAGLTGRLLRRHGRLGGTYSLAGILGAVFFTLFLVIGIGLSDDLNHLPLAIFVLADFAGSAAVAGLLVIGVAGALPRRRRLGPIRWRNKAATAVTRVTGGLIVLGAVPASIAAVQSVFYTGWFDRLQGVIVAVVMSGILILIGGLVIVGAELFTARTVDETLPADDSGVLFIRSFGSERHPFFIDDGRLRASFEAFLGDTVNSRIGPVVALGNPTDRIAPRGAARDYRSDQDWQTAVARLAARARCILAVPSGSPSLEWEYGYLRRAGLHQKLFILTPPLEADPDAIWDIDRGSWTGQVKSRLIQVHLALYNGHFSDLGHAARYGRPARPAIDRRWAPIAASLASAGYPAAIADPGPGAVLTFEPDGTATVLTRNAASADEYVNVIMHRLASPAV